MKILYYIHTLGIGGAETIVTNYLLALQAHGHQVALVVNDNKDTFLAQRLLDKSIRIHALRADSAKGVLGKCKRGIWKYTNYYQKRWKQILDMEKPDVLHIHTATNFMKRINFLPKKMIYTFHGDALRYIKMHGKKNSQIIKQFAQEGMTFFSLREEMTRDIKKYFRTDKIEYIPNGLDIEGIQNEKYDRERLCDEIGVSQETFLIAHIGRIHPIKNQLRTIEIFAEVVRKCPNARLLLIGESHGDYSEKIEAQIGNYGVEEKVIWLGVRSDAVAIMSAVNVLILPSLSECLPLVMIEAQAQGVRIVASDVVPREVICNNNCFRLSLRESNEVWADYLLGDFTEETGRDLENFSMDKVLDDMICCYKEIARN